MRNVFDQYDKWENRLTHALASCLHEDAKLLRSFVKWAIGKPAPQHARLQIVEQQLPGENEIGLSEDDTERPGLPDGCIYDDRRTWCLAIESKIKSKLTADQLCRQRRELERREFQEIHQFAITKNAVKPEIQGVHCKRWTELYRWCRGPSGEFVWAKRLAEYLEIAEARMIEERYLQEGTLTTFTGVPFGPDKPYDYMQAKRVLKLAMDDLQSSSDLKKELGIDPKAPRRPAITGRDGEAVWDFLKLLDAPASFNAFPHLTLAIGTTHVLTMLTLPNGMKPEHRRRLTDLGVEGFAHLIAELTGNMTSRLLKVKGFVPWLELVQRHYRGRRSSPVVDGRLEVDTRAALATAIRTEGVSFQPGWLEAAFNVVAHKRSNLQLGIGAIFPYGRCPAIGTPEALDHIAAVWICCKPVLDTVLLRQKG